MILKFLNKSTVSRQLNLFIYNSSFLFSENNKGNGMKKFDRPRKPKDKQQLNKPQSQFKKPQNNINKNVKQQTELNQAQRLDQINLNEIKNKNDFKTFNIKADVNKQEINKKPKGFQKFFKPKQQNQLKKTNNMSKIDQKPKQFQQSSTKRAEQVNQALKQVGDKFIRIPRNKKKQPQKQKQQQTSYSKPIENFSNKPNQSQNQNKQQPKNVQTASTNMNKEKIQANKSQQTLNMKNEQKPIKSLEQIQRQQLEYQIAKKQKYFQQKVKQFKKIKNEQEQNNANQSFILDYIAQFQHRISKKIYQLTGIDIGNSENAPNFVRKNPFLFYLYSNFFNIRFLMFSFIVFGLIKLLQVKIKQITPEQFVQKIDNQQTFRITFQEKVLDEYQQRKRYISNAIIQLKNGQIYQCVSNNQFQSLVKMKVNELNSQISNKPPIIIVNSRVQKINMFLSFRTILSLVLLYLFINSIMGSRKGASNKGGGGVNLFEQSKSKRFQQKVNVKFNDVVGMQKAKQQIVQFIDFLMNPSKYHKLGAKIPRGALLTGPPGTGKTMIAKACAGQSNVPFFTISGSQFMEMYVGVGAQRVRDLFKQAKQAAPSIIFIDEIDAVGKKRAAGFGGGNDERDNTLNQLLVQMDGFNTDSNVIVFAATNQKQVLDSALTRPGRFDRLIQVDLPDIEGRKQIFMVHLRPIVIDQQSSMEQYARRMATLTPGFSGADIKNLCNEAAIMAARNEGKFVTLHDFQLATQRVIGGVQKKSHLITPETKKIVAYHECGHGVVSWFLQGANPLLKLTIIPRSKGSLGFAQYLPHETQISTKKQLQDQICVILAGRVTQEIFFSRISTGAYDDLQKAYNIANMIVTQYGMNEKLGWLSFQQSQYAKHYSKQTQKLIDEQILKIIKKCTEKTRQVITQKRQLIQKLAQQLLQAQTIDLSTISKILGERPFKPNKQYQQYLKEHKKMTEQSSKAIAMKTKMSDYIL